MSAAWKGYFNTAVTDWNKSTVVKFAVVKASNNKACTLAQSNKVDVCNAKYGATGWLGLANVLYYIASGHIVGATAKMNDSYAMTTAEKQLVMCQEIGHGIGLGHQDENFDNKPKKSCMDYTSTATASQNMHPNSHDYAQLKTIYKHADAASTRDLVRDLFLPPVLSDSLEVPSQWGRLVRSGNDGRTETYDLDLGGGLHVATFVIWVRE